MMMVKPLRVLSALAVGAFLASSAFADGMIVPIRPEIMVRGSWAVKYHHVRITVREQVASVAIDQEFVNTGQRAIEVEYLFPVPPSAAIDSMTLVVDGKEMAAKLLPAEEARRIYESIVRSKKDPALLEYAGFGLYRTRAFPLEPGKPAKVLVTYKNVCKRDRDLVEVWYPLNTEKFSAKPIEDVEVLVDIKSDTDVAAVYSPTHDLNVQRKEPRHVVATYQAKNTLPATDFQVFYKAANEAVSATLLTYQPEAKKDGFFMMLASPNPRTAKESVVAKDIVIVFDHSGSMSGKKLEQARESLRFILNNLNKEDRFGVIAFNDSIEPFSDKLQDAAKPNLSAALERLDRVEATGGTNIHEALQTAMKLCPPKGGGGDARPQYIIFLTDGLPTVGNTKEADILTETQKANAAHARLFAFGVGYDVNVRLLDKLVADNNGKSDYVKPNEPIESKVSSLYAKIKNPVMTDIKAAIQNVQMVDTYPREVGDLFEGDQVLVVGRYLAQDVEKLRLAEGKYQTQLVIKGIYEGKERAFEYPVTVNPGGRDSPYGFVEKLWAIRRVGWLLDQIQLHGESKEVLDELVRLSMQHGIMTPYTSFLAEETTRLADGRELRMKAAEAAKPLAEYSGAGGQMAAMNRQEMNSAMRQPAASAPGEPMRKMGYAAKDSYEKGEAETVANVRQSGQNTLYRRGRLWITPGAAKLDPDKDADKIKSVERFTQEYFDLVRANTVSENQVMATQKPNEELLIELRGQAYRIR